LENTALSTTRNRQTDRDKDIVATESRKINGEARNSILQGKSSTVSEGFQHKPPRPSDRNKKKIKVYMTLER
jgi:hypothetical protein